MFYRKLYILLLVLPMVLMAATTTKVLQRGLDGYDGAQDAGIACESIQKYGKEILVTSKSFGATANILKTDAYS